MHKHESIQLGDNAGNYLDFMSSKNLKKKLICKCLGQYRIYSRGESKMLHISKIVEWSVLLCIFSSKWSLSLFLKTFQIQARRMSQFNEGEKAKEESRKYQKTAQVLTLFIISYIAQWLAPIIYKSWVFIMQPPNVLVRKILIKLNVRFLITARKPSLGQSNIMSLPNWGVSVQERCLCPGGLCPWGSLSRDSLSGRPSLQ